MQIAVPLWRPTSLYERLDKDVNNSYITLYIPKARRISADLYVWRKWLLNTLWNKILNIPAWFIAICCPSLIIFIFLCLWNSFLLIFKIFHIQGHVIELYQERYEYIKLCLLYIQCPLLLSIDWSRGRVRAYQSLRSCPQRMWKSGDIKSFTGKENRREEGGGKQ